MGTANVRKNKYFLKKIRQQIIEGTNVHFILGVNLLFTSVRTIERIEMSIMDFQKYIAKCTIHYVVEKEDQNVRQMEKYEKKV